MEKNESTKADEKSKKRTLSDHENGDVSTSRRPKRAAACTNLKEKTIRIPRKSTAIEPKKLHIAEDEVTALHLTAMPSNDPIQTRRLTNFILHDTNGVSQPMEMLEINNIFISGVILPLDEYCSDKEKAKGVKCESFGRVESWNIAGYDDGSPVIWISTKLADYDCLKPATTYKKIYDYFFDKASVSIAVYKKLSKSSPGGDPNTSLEELLATVVRSMSGRSKLLSSNAAIEDFVISQGQFVYNQLSGLDKTAKKHDTSFAESPVLVTLRDMSVMKMKGNISHHGSLKIHEANSESKVMAYDGGDDEDLKHAKIIQDEEYRKSMKTPRRNNKNTASNNKYYIKINEDEIANDYPLPCYYKNSQEEADELLFSESNYEVINPEDLPRRILQNWTLYNIDSRLISLELLPMKPCADIDVTIYGSGFVAEVKEDDERWAPLGESEASKQDHEGMAINLSQVKEWMIEYGSSMISISLRTDVAWYRLEKPSEEYAPWHEPVLKTARIAISIIGMLEEQTRLAKLSFANIIKKLSQFEKNDEAYISSNPLSVERYVVVHGQIILQIFASYPNNGIRKCPFITSLGDKMLEKHHTKWTIKNKKISERMNLNPMKGMSPMVSKKRVMQATTTLLINRIWGADFYNYAEDGSLQVSGPEIEVVEFEGEAENEEEDDEEEEEEDDEVDIATESANTPKKLRGGGSEKMEIRWLGEIVGTTSAGEPLYRQAFLGEQVVAVGGAVMVEADGLDDVAAAIYFVEYMFESSDHSKMLHGRLLQRGSETVLGDSANEGELFMTNECMTLKLKDIQGTVGFEFRSRPWGYQYRKENAIADKLDRERAEERKAKGLPIEYYCRSMYLPERGGFFRLSQSEFGLGSGLCDSCKNREEQKERLKVKVNENKTGFSSNGVDYYLGDYVYVIPKYTNKDVTKKKAEKTFRSGPNIGLKAFVVCQILEIIAMKTSRKGSFTTKVRRFYRPEDVSSEKGYSSDMQELYYSEDVCIVPLEAFQGKCQVRSKIDMPLRREYPLLDHIFFCEHFYDSSNGSLYQLPADIKSKFYTIKDDMLLRKKKGKGLESTEAADELPKEMRLATLDIFAGCGGLSYGLEQAGVCETKWAIEYDEQAGQAFRQNHPESTVFINNCNVILRAMMEKCGDQDDCISTKEADEFAAKLDDKEKRDLPIPGQVDFINGGPPCQGFSELNKYKDRFWSKVQCQMILAFLSFADYFRPKYFLLENVKSFVRNTKTFQLTLASLLEMGYQVRFGILEAGAYGVSQSRKRAIIWAASPEEIIPEWPEPMHVFYAHTQKISLSKGLRYSVAPSTKFGAPFRSITVRDTIGDLPPVENGESNTQTEYLADPFSWFQKGIRRDNMIVLTDHICKPMSELNLIRCKRIPKRPGADWRDLPDEKVKLSHGQFVDLVPMCLPNKAKSHNGYKGLYGRLDWEGNFPTSITDPQPMGTVGLCFHPDQDRMATVRECARSQGFPDSFEFSGKITNKHRQIGNAVPPPLAFALGRKLKEAIQLKMSLQDQD